MKKIIYAIAVALVSYGFSGFADSNPLAAYAERGANSLIASPSGHSTTRQANVTPSQLQNVIDAKHTTRLANGGQQLAATDNSIADPVKDKAFASTVDSLMPLTPSQIRSLHEYYQQTKNAVDSYPGVPPKPTSTSLVVNLSPNGTPPTISMSSGYISTLNFLDVTGQPWKITSVDMGDPKDYNVQVTKSGTALLLQSLADSRKVANLAVTLKGLPTPVMITLLSGQSVIDYRVDLHIPKFGPDAKPDVNAAPNVESPDLLNVLDGIPPKGSHELKITDPGSQAWRLGHEMYLRTRMTVISPAWVSSMQSGDGTHAYQLPMAPIVLAMQHGKIVKINITGDEIS